MGEGNQPALSTTTPSSLLILAPRQPSSLCCRRLLDDHPTGIVCLVLKRIAVETSSLNSSRKRSTTAGSLGSEPCLIAGRIALQHVPHSGGIAMSRHVGTDFRRKQAESPSCWRFSSAARAFKLRIRRLPRRFISELSCDRGMFCSYISLP
jgi:hypothetical protein